MSTRRIFIYQVDTGEPLPVSYPYPPESQSYFRRLIFGMTVSKCAQEIPIVVAIVVICELFFLYN